MADYTLDAEVMDAIREAEDLGSGPEEVEDKENTDPGEVDMEDDHQVTAHSTADWGIAYVAGTVVEVDIVVATEVAAGDTEGSLGRPVEAEELVNLVLE